MDVEFARALAFMIALCGCGREIISDFI